MQAIRSKVNVLLPRLKYTCQNLSVHGPSYLARKDVHIIYRIIYFIIYVNVWIVAVAGIYKYLSTYQEDTIRFTTRNDYILWNTSFPSITVCELGNIDRILSIAQTSNEGSSKDIAHFAKDIVFFNGECSSCTSMCANESTCSFNLEQLNSKYRTECKEFFVNCTWDDKPMNCCQHFFPLQTEYGKCFTMNNNQLQRKLPLYHVAMSNRRRLGGLELSLAEDFEVFLHAPDDIPYWNIEYDRKTIVPLGSRATVLFSIADIINDPEVSLIASDVRQCRFPDESPENYQGYKFYSYSVCIIQCRIEAQIELCNCTSHLSPEAYKDQYCNLEGLKCLTRNHEKFKNFKLGISDIGLTCDCLSSCVEPDYNIIFRKVYDPDREIKAGTVKFVLSNRPYERVTRQVAKTGLDLVVAIGNCFGLCFGGSILSIVEFFYYICLKQWRYSK